MRPPVVLTRRPGTLLALALASAAAVGGCAARPNRTATPVAPPDSTATATATAAGPTFRVICHFPDPALARAALQLAESATRITTELWSPASPPPPGSNRVPEIHLYRTIQDFDRAAEALTRRTNHDNLNFFLGDRLQSHILVQPLLSDAALARLGLPLLTKFLVAFEAAQLVRAAHAPGWSLQPAWYVAGLGKWVALRTLRAAGSMPDPMSDPLLSSNIYDLQQLQRRLPAPTPDNTIEAVTYWTNAAAPGELVAGHRPERNTHLPLPSEVLLRDLSGSLSQNEFFGLAWLMFETLMSPRFEGPARALMAELQAVPSPDGAVSPVAAAAIARGGGLKRIVALRMAERTLALFRPDQLDELDGAFQRALTALTPRWSEEARSLDAQGSDWVQIAYPLSLRGGNRAAAWSLERAPGASFSIGGRAVILPNFGHQMNVFLELDDAQFLQVSFVAGDGVWFWLYDRGRSAWIDRRHLPVPGIEVEAPFAFRVAHAGEIVTVELGGRLVARLPLDKPANGRWGLGVSEGTAAIWSNVRVATLGAR